MFYAKINKIKPLEANMKTAKLSIDISEDVYSTLEIEGYTKSKLEKKCKGDFCNKPFF